MPFTTFGLNSIANRAWGATAYTVPASWWLIPLTAITDAYAGTFTRSTGIAAFSVTNNTTNFPNATTSGNTIIKSNGVAFTSAASTVQETIVGFAIAGSQSGPDVWFVQQLTTTRLITVGNAITIPANSLSMTLAGGLTATGGGNLLNNLFGNVAVTIPTNWFVSPLTAVTNAFLGTVTESSVARVSVVNNTTNFPNATGTTQVIKSNATLIQTANFGSGATIVGAGMYSASTGGTLWFAGSLGTSAPVTAGQPFSFTAGNLQWRLS